MATANSTAEKSEPIHLSVAAATPPAADTATTNTNFADERVVVVAYNDSRIAKGSNSHCRIEQDFDGPTYLVIGPRATSEQLARAAARFDLAGDELVSFRDSLREEDGERQNTFKPFSWLSPTAQRFPLSRFAASTRDLSEGLALTLEILEGAFTAGLELDSQPPFSSGQLSVLSRFAVATAKAIHSEACENLAWLNEHGAAHVRKGAFIPLSAGGDSPHLPDHPDI